MEEKIYDLIILGGGPAGMSAGIYASQMKLSTLLIEKGDFGGQIATTSSVSNYLGFDNISGKELSEKMQNHLSQTDVKVICEEVVKTELTEDLKRVYTHNNCYTSKTVIVGIGTAVRKLGVENEQKYVGKGISYSSLKDREKYTDKIVAVVGGGNSAIEDAIYLSEKAKKVYLIHRRNEFRGDELLVEQLMKIVATQKIELVLESKPLSIEGNNQIIALNITYIPDGTTKRLELDGIFVAIGRGADTDIIDNSIQKDANGYIVTNEEMQTNLSGVYAVGDIRTTPFRQIVTAVSDGAIASMKAYNYIKAKNNKK